MREWRLSRQRTAPEYGIWSNLSVFGVKQALHIPHFKSKAEIQQALRDSGMAYTLIMANNVFLNDLAYRESILEEGIYPQPIGDIGLNCVDVHDIADAVVTSLTQTGHEFQSYPFRPTPVDRERPGERPQWISRARHPTRRK
jgi:uncharacterized protein YbjT (DUF2867 family)